MSENLETELCGICGEETTGHHRPEEHLHCRRCCEYVGFHGHGHGIEDCLDTALGRIRELRRRVEQLEAGKGAQHVEHKAIHPED